MPLMKKIIYPLVYFQEHKMSRLVNKEHISNIDNYFKTYFEHNTPNCKIHSNDGFMFEIHKEVLSQTNFLREILTSAKEQCCLKIEIFCPCSKDDLYHLINFLYNGEINCAEESESLKIQENLYKIFGFSKYLGMNWQNGRLQNLEAIKDLGDINCSVDSFEDSELNSQNKTLQNIQSVQNESSLNTSIDSIFTQSTHVDSMKNNHVTKNGSQG